MTQLNWDICELCMCVTWEIKKKPCNEAENIKNVKNILFYFFVICVVFRQLNVCWRATLKWGWYGVAQSGASCLRLITAQSFPYRHSYKQVVVSRVALFLRYFLKSLSRRMRKIYSANENGLKLIEMDSEILIHEC